MNDVTKRPAARRVNFRAAAMGRCPACGQGNLFKGFLGVVDTCDRCEANFKATQTGDGPVVFVILIAGFVVCFGFMITNLNYPDMPMWLNMAIWMPLALILTLGLMRPLKGLMIAAQFKNRVKD